MGKVKVRLRIVTVAISIGLVFCIVQGANARDLTIGIDFTGIGVGSGGGGTAGGFGSISFPVQTTGGGNTYQAPPNSDIGGQGEISGGYEVLLPTVMIMFPMFPDMFSSDRPNEFDVKDMQELTQGQPFPPIGDDCYGQFGHEGERHLFVEYIPRESRGIAWIEWDIYKSVGFAGRWIYGHPDGLFENVRAPVASDFIEKFFMACTESDIPDNNFYWDCRITSRILDDSAGGQINYRVSYPIEQDPASFDYRDYKGPIRFLDNCIQIHEQE